MPENVTGEAATENVAEILDIDLDTASEVVANVQNAQNGEMTASANGMATRQEFQMRFALAQALGENLPVDDDDYYDVFNWDKHPTVEDYFALALRNPFAYAVTFLEPEIAWRNPPKIVDTGAEPEAEEETEFETAVRELNERLRTPHFMRRAHKLAGIGKFGILVIQFDDTDGPNDLSEPVGDPDDVIGLKPFSRASITDVRVGGPGTDRWGEPVRYKVDFSDENEQEGAINHQGPETVWIHHTRVIHIPSDELLDDELRGIERQKPVYNNLIDIERALGAAGTLAYRAAAWGIHVNIDKDFDLEDGGEQLREHLERWNWGLEPILRTHGADDVKSLGGENIDPGPIIDKNVEAISVQKGIPQSVLKGNETGERATTQDLKEWYGKISGHQVEFLEPLIVREWHDRLQRYDIVPEPAGDGYAVQWDPLFERSTKDEADIQSTRAQTLQRVPELEMELSAAEQAQYIEEGEFPNDLHDRVQARNDVQVAMGELDDGADTR